MSDHESTSQFFGDKLKEEPDCPLCQELNCIGLHKECVFGPHGAPCSASIKCSESEDHIIAKNPLFPRLSGRAPSVTQICGRKAEDEEPRVVGQQDGKPTPSSEKIHILCTECNGRDIIKAYGPCDRVDGKSCHLCVQVVTLEAQISETRTLLDKL
ncbi:hypothetical protein CVT25_010432 [Psilocybe cyanescens]|uniref:Uncharacterized protein n=1 Tax=Psilocybe cyanescens TaxID=93625 RepID=A0A409XP38_PSICY|nr:hypothetical protein CVT25_010432 [Psilocybe cyanescens]